MTDGLLAVGLDKWGNFGNSVYGGADCNQTRPQSPHSIVVRGPGSAYSGYCILASYSLVGNGKVSLQGDPPPNSSDDESYATPNSRTLSARRVRIVVDAASAPDRRIKVYYASDTNDANLQLLINTSAPAAIYDAPSFRWGFVGTSVTAEDSKDIWDVVVNAAVDIPPPSINGTLPDGSPSVAYSSSVDIVGGLASFDVSLTSGSLPPGITMSSVNTTITFAGLPTTTGTFTFNITVVDSRLNASIGDAGVAQQQLTIAIAVPASPTPSPSASASSSGTASISVTTTVSASNSVVASISPSPSSSLTSSCTASLSPSESASASSTGTVSHTGSSSVSPSRAASVSVSPSRAASVSVSPSNVASVSVSPSGSSSLSASPSRSASTTGSQSSSPSVAASVTVSPSVSPSSTRSPTRSGSVTPTTSPTATRSETASRTGTPSETMTSTETGTMTSTATMTVSATATRSSSGTPGVIVPGLSVQFTLVGGDEEDLRAGTGQLLRQAVNEIVGVDGATTSFTALLTNYTVTPVENVYALANATANSTTVNATSTVPGSFQAIGPNDPDLNAPLRRLRQLQGSSCSPVVLPANGTLTLPVTTAYMMVQIPAGYFSSNGAYTAEQIAALIAALQARFYLQLANPGVVTTAFAGFTQAWSACTGVPDSAGIIAAIAAPAAVNVPSPTPVPGPDNSKMRNGVLIGVITGGLFIMLVVAIAIGCSRRRTIFAPKNAFMFIAGAHECELSQVWDWPIRVPAAGGNADAPAWTIRACPHITLKYTAGLALRAAGFELSDQLLQGTSLVFKDRIHTVREQGDKPLGDLNINVDTAKGVVGVILLDAAASAPVGASAAAGATAAAGPRPAGACAPAAAV